MKEMKVNYTLKKTNDKYSVLMNYTGTEVPGFWEQSTC